MKENYSAESIQKDIDILRHIANVVLEYNSTQDKSYFYNKIAALEIKKLEEERKWNL